MSKKKEICRRPAGSIRIKGNGRVFTVWGGTEYHRTPTSLECTSSILVNGREFIVTDVFPLHPTSTPTAKLKSYIDLKKD